MKLSLGKFPFELLRGANQRKDFAIVGAMLLASFAHVCQVIAKPVAETSRPNILFIAIDDMRDWTGYSGDAQAKTPNLDRLAKSGVAFTRAYTACALCNPSRTALLSGLRPGTTGVYGNGEDWRTALPADAPSLPGYFRANGYQTMTSGKIFHGGKLRREDWDDIVKDSEREELDFDKQDWTLFPNKPAGGFTIGSNVVLGTDAPEADLVDSKTAAFGVERLGRTYDKPFFIACGFHRPHLPLIAPRKYFDMFPLEDIVLPALRTNDLADLSDAGKKMAKPGEFAAIQDADKWKECVRGYLACIAYTDAQVGRLLDALENSPQKSNTIICLWSDHGWHHGEKEHWRKSTLWEEATRSPMIFVAPGVTKAGSVCARPVDFLGIYPTLCDLAGLPLPTHLEGVTLRPLLADVNAAWERPAISTMKRNNHAVRSDRWRYIRYAGGDEELYDHDADPHEWTNLAGEERYASVKAELAEWIPTENKFSPGAAGKKDKAAKKAKKANAAN